jgi:hypothetical protein
MSDPPAAEGQEMNENVAPEEVPQEEAEERGKIDVDYLPPAEEDEPSDDDLFEREEKPRSVVLADLDQADAPEFIEALKAQGIGAKLGSPTDQGGVEVIIHEANLADAQAILVDFTGDVSLVEDMDTDGDLVPVSSGHPVDVSSQAERLSIAGIDVRLELPAPDDERIEGTLWVARDDADEARRVLGITI